MNRKMRVNAAKEKKRAESRGSGRKTSTRQELCDSCGDLLDQHRTWVLIVDPVPPKEKMN